MDVFDSHENSSESSISLASSVFTHDPDFSPYDSYVVDSDAPDDMDVDDDVQPPQHYGPPSYESLMLENTTVRSDADFFSVTGWTTATIGSSSVVSTSETRCPTPASAPAADLQVQEPRSSDSSMTTPSPVSHVVGRASDISTGVDSLFNYRYAFVFQDDQGLCGIGAWADIATSPLLAKKKRMTPRQ
ncbi:hypothetical protein NXS19_000625 [Fusarium pseudograminearum]|uniref:Uncharacterized protein n=1 Tax=Fusarium pseudograminearum (strain CS3096) TaxID=1028729 RepID=K3VNS2_FUSPC|nr:hypothetical protein FPSE_04427 [Fusarium pseudograminearum CS3096]EKJ75408.1 hypothetical protein FPSE_04427 [Fusarium pseudograminearum CS3096]KAF0639794.1 hypothetical protein FPSE5266_04427 [Fusarium pseudograminearum]UZP32809.1 hypothetical protein NXS19_000625 [Fusarium pseudograminearum]